MSDYDKDDAYDDDYDQEENNGHRRDRSDSENEKAAGSNCVKEVGKGFWDRHVFVDEGALSISVHVNDIDYRMRSIVTYANIGGCQWEMCLHVKESREEYEVRCFKAAKTANSPNISRQLAQIFVYQQTPRGGTLLADKLLKCEGGARLNIQVGEVNKNMVNMTAVVRVVKPRAQRLDTLFKVPLSDSESMLTLLIDGEKFFVNKNWLTCISRVFVKMLSEHYKEGGEKAVKIELPVNLHSGRQGEQSRLFHEFLLATAMHPADRVSPNPKNVQKLLQLADFFEVAALTAECEERLKHCYEISLSQRFELVSAYKLNALKDHLSLLIE